MESGDVSSYASPTHAKELSGLPPTYVDVGELDLFRNEDIEYVHRLALANITVEFHLYPGLPHGFEAVGGPDVNVTKQVLANRIKFILSL